MIKYCIFCKTKTKNNIFIYTKKNTIFKNEQNKIKSNVFPP